MKSLTAAAALLHLAAGQGPEEGVIRPGAPWYTVDGRRMYAGGANMYLNDDGRYYLIGEGNKTYSDCSDGFNMYSSSDLENWRFEGAVLNNSDLRAAVPPPFNNASYPFYRMERPKVFKCPGTGRFTLWFHCDTDAFSLTSVGVLTADSITGPYTWASQCFKPDGRDSYDMGVFYDDPAMPGGDGHMYLMRSVENAFAGISRMSEDCLNVTGIISSGPHMEAQALMRDATGVLHYVGSHETGWGANEAFFVTSPNASLVGAIWGNDYNPSHSGDTYNSQSTFLYPFRHADGHVTHIWMADRWNMWGPGSIQNMTNIWLPLVPPSGPSPTVVLPGDLLQLNACNGSDPTQTFQWNSNATVTHSYSGLCVTQPPDATTDTPLYMTPCAGDGSGAPLPNQTWYRTGESFNNVSYALGPDCVSWNTPMQEDGGAVILYRCGNSTQYNSRWDAPLEPGTPGLFYALSDASQTGFCLSAGPQWNPSQWTMPWQDAWSLKDYAAQRGGAARGRPSAGPALLTLSVNVTTPLRRLANPFLSFNIDTSSIYNGFDWRDPVLVNLIYALNPLNSGGGVFVRVGGSAADYALYQPGQPTGAAGGGVTVFNDTLLEDLWQLAGQAHANVLMDLNSRSFRDMSTFGPWDPTGNATAILDYYNRTHAGSMSSWAWSIGNEPEEYPEHNANYTQLGLDAHVLSNLLRQYNVGRQVFGPSLNFPQAQAAAEYLTAARGAVTGLTVHSYPLGRDCNVSSYLNATGRVRAMGEQLFGLHEVRANISAGTLLVLEEVAGCYDGGCENVTDRFVGGFLWTTVLGVAATSMVDRVHRQDVAGWSGTKEPSHYQLAGPAGWTNGSALLTPHPDWYTSVLFKTMVGNTVLNSSLSGPDPSGVLSSVSVFAWCSGSPWWFNNSMVVTYSNPTGVDVSLDVQAVNISTVPRAEYMLTSDAAGYRQSRARVRAGRPATPASPLDPPPSLTADAVFLNGEPWTVDSNGILPALPVVGNMVTDDGQGIVLPPYSYGYLQFFGDGPKAC